MNQKLLHRMFIYDPERGVLIHKYTVQGGKRIGDVAGSPHNMGYRQICIGRKKYLIHRLIWLYVYGRWPNQIDHANGKRSDNRLKNLRNTCRNGNNRNREMMSNNTSGYKGIFLDKRNGTWFASIAHQYIGRFKSKTAAAAAYDRAAKRMFKGFAKTNKQLGKIGKGRS